MTDFILKWSNKWSSSHMSTFLMCKQDIVLNVWSAEILHVPRTRNVRIIICTDTHDRKFHTPVARLFKILGALATLNSRYQRSSDRHRLDIDQTQNTKVSDRCLIDVDPMIFNIRNISPNLFLNPVLRKRVHNINFSCSIVFEFCTEYGQMRPRSVQNFRKIFKSQTRCHEIRVQDEFWRDETINI